MRRTQIWCDYSECGRLIQDKRSDSGSDEEMKVENIDVSWEIWAPGEDDDMVFCSPECMTAYCMERFG